MIPHEREREDVEEVAGDDASIVFITTPGQVFVYFPLLLFAFLKKHNYHANEKMRKERRK